MRSPCGHSRRGPRPPCDYSCGLHIQTSAALSAGVAEQKHHPEKRGLRQSAQRAVGLARSRPLHKGREYGVLCIDPGSLIAALGMFLPTYLVVVLAAPHYRRFANNLRVRAFVDGVTAAATGAIAGAVFVLGKRALVDVPGIAGLLLFTTTQ